MATTVRTGFAVCSMPEIEVTPMSREEAEEQYGISDWDTWGCEASNFKWEYSGTEQAYVLRGSVLVTPTGEWASCKPTEVNAGDFVVFPDGMTCTWDVTEAIEKHYNFV
mmetsp:Transcript_3222/g.6875  ORF Transcript_3222/g.6875 Transcript_3222/m.6875 type:complete len:109 (-) Transcript_3222:145-471(-)|eukprot:CAMPEP_0182522432 /NCGR_PEP_ID=MMETSP1323-20130603/291_1 /TAXON_ID=236787 /ORGANISM="Florenciella parvula, Strain RCC1693" /LENGTH=108 /DNA_ID=CAMNT_0024730553 /DNA_START=176 /DNA_END=502 /DNA_ORIENTATION=+